MTRVGIFTCSIYPDLTRVWYQVLRRTFGDNRPATLIFDCGGGLRREWFPGAEVRRVPNWEHGRKIDLALREHEWSGPVWVLDDDVFPLSEETLWRGLAAFETESRMAAFTYHYRDWWRLPAAGGLHVPMGSYALLVRPEIIKREDLSFRSVKTSDPAIRSGTGFWDTADFLQKELLERGYAIGYASEDARRDIPTFFGTSGGFLTYARRALLARRYVCRSKRDEVEDEICADEYSFQRACSVAAVVEAFRGLLGGEPLFSDWFDEAELRALAAMKGDPGVRSGYAATADRVFRIRDSLLRRGDGPI